MPSLNGLHLPSLSTQGPPVQSGPAVSRLCVVAGEHSATIEKALLSMGELVRVPSPKIGASPHDCLLLPFESVERARDALSEADGGMPVLFFGPAIGDEVRMQLLALGAQEVLDTSIDDAAAIRRAVRSAIVRHARNLANARLNVERDTHLFERDFIDLTANSRVSRLEWLLQGVLEIQSLVTEATFEMDPFMQRVVDVAERLTDAKGAVIELVEGDEMVYRCASSSIAQHVGLRLKREGSLSGLCVHEAQVLRCDDTILDPRVNQEATRKVGVRSMLCTPLFNRGLPVGVLKVMGSEPGAFDSSDQYLLTLLAGALGAALGRQLVLETLKTSEETFRTAMELAPIGQALVRPDGQFIGVNKALCDLLGYSENELLALDFQSITHVNDLEEDVELVRRALAGEMQSYRMEKRYCHKSGRVILAVLSASLLREASGAPSYFVAQIQDVSEQRELERVKGEFISMVSHELRTPLTSIRGALGLVLGTMSRELPPKAKSLLDIANNNCQRLIRLINDILDIDKIASGNMRFDLQERPLADVVRKVVQSMESYAQKFHVRVELAPLSPDWKIAVDEDRLAQVISNLLSNAIKFSRAAELVRVSAQTVGKRIRLLVIDRGPGIPEEFHSRIFEKFSQADSSEARRAEGTGLGLHISQQIVERMNGTIGFETSLGQGTTFWIEFALTESLAPSIKLHSHDS